MQQRESEIREINNKMNVVNEIYKDLGGLVESQQDDIDTIENQFETANEVSRKALEQIRKANNNQKSGQKIKSTAEATIAAGEGVDDTAEGLLLGGNNTKRKQFFLFSYMSKTANELSKMVSVCTGGIGTASYVNDDEGGGGSSSWNIPTKK